jgi:hypothetical protein
MSLINSNPSTSAIGAGSCSPRNCWDFDSCKCSRCGMSLLAISRSRPGLGWLMADRPFVCAHRFSGIEVEMTTEHALRNENVN